MMKRMQARGTFAKTSRSQWVHERGHWRCQGAALPPLGAGSCESSWLAARAAVALVRHRSRLHRKIDRF